jgi:hypothetical protein
MVCYICLLQGIVISIRAVNYSGLVQETTLRFINQKEIPADMTPI